MLRRESGAISATATETYTPCPLLSFNDRVPPCCLTQSNPVCRRLGTSERERVKDNIRGGQQLVELFPSRCAREDSHLSKRFGVEAGASCNSGDGVRCGWVGAGSSPVIPQMLVLRYGRSGWVRSVPTVVVPMVPDGVGFGTCPRLLFRR